MWPFARKSFRPQNVSRRPVRQPLVVELLEDRSVPSAVSSIVGNFNGTPIPAGNTIWFNSALKVGGLGSAPVTLHVENETIDFTANGVAYHASLPNAVIVFSPGQTTASTSYDLTDNDFDTSVPSSGTGNVFMSGSALMVPTALPGGIKNVTWTASFWADTPGLNVSWAWGASVYKSFSSDNNFVGIKPTDAKNLGVNNGDKAGTPEAFKSAVVAGGTGNGGTNYTGNLTGAKNVNPTLGDGLQPYPYVSSNPLTSVAFNESTVLKGANLDANKGAFDLWYSDEHALALGVRQVNVKTATGTTPTNYPLAAMTQNPDAAVNPALGTLATSGDQAGTDASGRLLAPSLYITDTTGNPNSRSGDWKFGGQAYSPSAVFGAWKGFTRTVDNTHGGAVSLVADVDPARNGWNLGPNADVVPAGLTNEGYGAEVRWNISDLASQGIQLVAGHTYRFYVIVHDGDQNKAGGDCGQASFTYTYNPTTTLPPAKVGGMVTDNVGMPLAGVKLTLSLSTPSGLTFVASTTTGQGGTYSFSNVLPGTYVITLDPSTLPMGDLANSASPGSIDGGTTTDGHADNASTISGIVLGSGDNGLNYNFTAAAIGPNG